MVLLNRFLVYLLVTFASWRNNFVSKLQIKRTQYNAWFAVLIAVLLVLAFTIYAAMQVWCVMYKGKHFTGNWNWSVKGVQANVECR